LVPRFTASVQDVVATPPRGEFEPKSHDAMTGPKAVVTLLVPPAESEAAFSALGSRTYAELRFVERTADKPPPPSDQPT
jgi:hypothetical protein